MTSTQLISDVTALYREKGLDCTGDHIAVLQEVTHYLARQGIAVDREILDFAIDVLRVKNLVGLSQEAGYDEYEEARARMTDWLEALGWRRDWFLRDWTRQPATGSAD
jgi:hypothetical protein